MGTKDLLELSDDVVKYVIIEDREPKAQTDEATNVKFGTLHCKCQPKWNTMYSIASGHPHEWAVALSKSLYDSLN